MLSDTDIQEIIKKYENKFGMSSEEFTRKWKADEVPDTFETNDWAILLSID